MLVLRGLELHGDVRARSTQCRSLLRRGLLHLPRTYALVGRGLTSSEADLKRNVLLHARKWPHCGYSRSAKGARGGGRKAPRARDEKNEGMVGE